MTPKTISDQAGTSTASRDETAGTEQRFRVAVLNTHPIQYFAPLYAYIQAHCPDIDLTVIYFSDSSIRGEFDTGFGEKIAWDMDLLHGYHYKFIGKNFKKTVPGGFWSLATPSIWGELRREKYDLVWLHGYAHAALLIALVAAKSVGSLVALRGDSTLLLNNPGPKRVFRNAVLQILFKSFDVFFAVGARSRDYYRYQGVAPQKIISMPYAVDNLRFESSERRPGSAGKPVVLFASKLVRRKDPFSFVDAAVSVLNSGAATEFIIAGSGELEKELKDRVPPNHRHAIRFIGFINQRALPTLMANATIFVLTSDWEPWGLVVNEAMAAGLAVILSHDVGCCVDLLEDGINGLVVRAGAPDELARAILRITRTPGLAQAMGRSAKNKISRYSYEACVEGIRQVMGIKTQNQLGESRGD